MPVESPSQSVLDPSSEDMVGARGARYRPGVRQALGAVTSALADSRDVDAEAAQEERYDQETRHAETPPIARSLVIRRPPGMGAFQFVVLSKLRAAQLMRGCRPRVDSSHKATVIAQLEVSAGKVTELPREPAAVGAAVSEDFAAIGVRA